MLDKKFWSTRVYILFQITWMAFQLISRPVEILSFWIGLSIFLTVHIVILRIPVSCKLIFVLTAFSCEVSLA